MKIKELTIEDILQDPQLYKTLYYMNVRTHGKMQYILRAIKSNYQNNRKAWKNCHFFVAFVGKHVVGWSTLWTGRDTELTFYDASGFADFVLFTPGESNYYVPRKYRRCGIGTALANAVKSKRKRNHFVHIFENYGFFKAVKLC